MINLISRSIVSKHSRGPRKVVSNLIKGLDKIDYPYVINHSLNATTRLWIHDDPVALKKSETLEKEVHVIAGPNIFATPREIPTNSKKKDNLWLYPSVWVQHFWELSPFVPKETDTWPVGIDTEKFIPSLKAKKHILVYEKQRNSADTGEILTLLEKRQVPYKTLSYGSYSEQEYLDALSEAYAIIWIGRSESQGIGLEEALSMNVPAFVWDINFFGEWSGTGKEKYTAEELSFPEATAAPYFDSRCGVIEKDRDKLNHSLDLFLKNLNSFSPRDYVLGNLTLEKQARAFVELYETHFGLSYSEGLVEKPRNTKMWRNANMSFKVLSRAKDFARKLING